MWLRLTTVIGALLLLGGCGGEEGSTDLIVPRGATLSIQTAERIATNTHSAGDRFEGEINVPLRRGTTIFVPLLARVEGSVDSVRVDQEGRNRIALRIHRLHVPSGQAIELKTVPLVRQSKAELETQDVTVKTGLDVDIDILLGNISESERRRKRAEADALVELAIPRDSHLVFTLEEDIRIPAP